MPSPAISHSSIYANPFSPNGPPVHRPTAGLYPLSSILDEALYDARRLTQSVPSGVAAGLVSCYRTSEHPSALFDSTPSRKLSVITPPPIPNALLANVREKKDSVDQSSAAERSSNSLPPNKFSLPAFPVEHTDSNIQIEPKIKNEAGLKNDQDLDNDPDLSPCPPMLTDSQSTLTESTELRSSPTTIDPARLQVDFSDLRNRIGVGTYGSVFVGRYFGELVAVKRVRMPDASPALRNDPEVKARRAEAMRQFAREIRRYERVSHPGIVRFLGVTIPQDSSALLVTELMPGGSLGDAITGSRQSLVPFSISSVLKIALQACGGLRALHAADCTWGDAKPANILLSAQLEADGEFGSSAEARIADFGLSRCVGQSLLADTTVGSSGQPAGTYNYMAPETFTGINEDESAKASDIYSFGMVIYEMLTLRTPWKRCQMMDVYSNVMNGERPAWPIKDRDEDYYRPIPNELQQLVEKCWLQDPQARPTAEQLFDCLNTYLRHTRHTQGDQRPVSDITTATPFRSESMGKGSNAMPRVDSKQSSTSASTAVPICDSVDIGSHGLEGTRDLVRYTDADVSDNELLYSHTDGSINARINRLSIGPRVSPVTSPEPRSLSNYHDIIFGPPQSHQDMLPPSSSTAPPDAEHHMPHPVTPSSTSLHGTTQEPARREDTANQAEPSLENSVRWDVPLQSSFAPEDSSILEQFSHQDLEQIPTTDFIKHRQEIALATAQAAAQLSHVGGSGPHSSYNLRERDYAPNNEYSMPSLTQTGSNSLEASVQDLNSSTASFRRKRSKRLQNIIEHAAMAFLEIRRREDMSSKMPPKQKKEAADKKAAEYAKALSEKDALKAIDEATVAGDFSRVLDFMKSHRDSHSVARAGATFLEKLSSNQDLYYDMCEEGAVEELVSTASMFGQKDAALCILFCNSMTALSEHYDDKVGHLIRGVGVPSLLIEILEQHKTDVIVQTSGCESLAIIAASSELSRSAVATLGGPAAVYRAMTKNNTSFRDVSLAKACLKAVRHIAQDNERAAEFLVQSAALDAVSRVAEVFTDHGLENDILLALRAFSFYNGGRRNIIMSSGLKALTAIMLRQRDPDFLVQCCTFIRAIARWRDVECEDAMLQSCIAERITSLMQVSNDIPGEQGARVAWYASHACTFLASFGSRSRQRLRLVGAIETTIGVLNSRRENARVVRSATDALAELIKSEPEAKIWAERYGAVLALNTALELHESIPRVKTAIQWTLDYLSSTKNFTPKPVPESSNVQLERNKSKENTLQDSLAKADNNQVKSTRRFRRFHFGRRK